MINIIATGPNAGKMASLSIFDAGAGHSCRRSTDWASFSIFYYKGREGGAGEVAILSQWLLSGLLSYVSPLNMAGILWCSFAAIL